METIQDHRAKEHPIFRVIGFYRPEISGPRPPDFQSYHANVRMPASVTDRQQPVTGQRGLGLLGKLPIELLTIILADYLDMQTCFNLRQVDRLGRAIVSNMFEYRAVTCHASTCYLAALRTRAATWINLGHLYRVLRTWQCEVCGREAVYLYLPTATRACEPCLADHPAFRTIIKYTAAKFNGFPDLKLPHSVRVLHALPGYYSAPRRKVSRRPPLVGFVQARDAIVRDTGFSTLDMYVGGIEERLFCYMATTFLPYLDARKGVSYMC